MKARLLDTLAILPLALAVSLASSTARANDDVGGFFCLEYDSTTRLGYLITATGAALALIESNWDAVVAPEDLDDAPSTTTAALANALHWNRSLFIATHGSFGGDLYIGPYLTRDGARAAQVADSIAGYDVEPDVDPHYGAYWLKLTPSLVSSKLRPKVHPEAIFVSLGCYSARWVQYFFANNLLECDPNPTSCSISGPSSVGYNAEMWSDNLVLAYDFIVASMTCTCSPDRYASIEGLVGDWGFGGQCRGLIEESQWDIRGNAHNGFHRQIDCLRAVETSETRDGGRPAWLPLAAVPAPLAAGRGLVRSADPFGVVSPRQTLAASTHEVEQRIRKLSGPQLAPPPRSESSAIEKTLEPQCPLCADVIIYSSSEAMANAAAHHFTYQDNGHGQNSEVRIIVGGVDPSSVTDALEETIAANFDFNEEHLPNRFPVHPGPVVVLVGDASPVVVRTPTMEDEHEACGDWDCRTYFDLVDLNQDGRPEAPIQVIPAQTVQDVWDICDRAEEWNDGDWVEPSGSVAVFMDDLHSGAQRTFLNEALSITEDYGNAGIPSRGINLDSQNQSGTQCAAGATLINRGVRDLWVMGRQTTQDNWTRGMHDCNLGALTRKQRLVVFAPNCQTAAIWRGDALAEQLLLADSAGTAAAAVLGNLNGDYWRKHQIAGHVLREEYLSAAVGTPLSRILYDAVCRLGDLGYSHLARGMVMLGGHAVKRGESAPQGIVEPSATWQRQGPRLWPTPWDGRGMLYLSNVDGCDAATVEVFNAAGAKVAEWDARADEQKRTERMVATSAAPDRHLTSGVYFARISCGGVKTARTLLVVR